MVNKKAETWDETLGAVKKQISKKNLQNIFGGLILGGIFISIVLWVVTRIPEDASGLMMIGGVVLVVVTTFTLVFVWFHIAESRLEKPYEEKSILVEHKYRTDLKRKYNAVFVDFHYPNFYRNDFKIIFSNGEKYTAKIYYEGDEIVIENLMKIVNVEDIMKKNNPESDKKDFDVIESLKINN